MYKTSVYTLVNGNIKKLAQWKQQKSQKMILPASHWQCVNVLFYYYKTVFPLVINYKDIRPQIFYSSQAA